jgi:hypothetical protein
MVFVALFGVAGLILLPTIFIIEAIVLLLLRWGNFWRCLLDSALANLASSLVGVVGVCGLVSGVEPDTTAAWIATLVVAFIISIAIEGAVLNLRQRRAATPHSSRVAWRAAVVTNVVSYVLLIGLFVLVTTGVIPL